MRLKIFAITIALTVVIVSCSKDADDNGPTGPANTAPELAEIADQTVNAGETENAELSATDVDGDLLSFSISTNPGFLSITGYSQIGDIASATLIMAPDESIYGTFDATVQVSDGGGGADSASFIIEVQQLPKIEWGYHSSYVSMTFRYSGGVLCGYTAYPHFRSIGGSGTVEFEARTTSGSVLVEQFNVLGGGQYYSLVIKGGLKEDPYPLPGETLIVESPSADTDYEDTVHYVHDMTINSMELELRP